MNGSSPSPDGGPDVPVHGIHAEMSGSAGDMVQARDVHGGVHFHGGGSDTPSGPTPRQLPGDVHGFVNRLTELGLLDRVLAGDPAEPLVVGVSVVAGTAGVGKTSLALHWAHRVRDRFPDGQLYVNLRGYDAGQPLTPEQVLEHFLRALHVPGTAIPADLEARAALYRSLLADRRMLVVLDNAMSERQVRPLLPGTAGSFAIVTSRDRLSGLAVRDGARRITTDLLTEDGAVTLIRAVTAHERPGDGEEQLRELARLCARLPLALRIAAERAASRPWMSLDELIGDLRDESHLWEALTTGDDENAEAVRIVFAWSYRALPEDAARLFRLLGLHPGPDFSVEAVAALAGTTTGEARRGLDVLVGAYLLERTPRRHQFHDLLRAYATDQARHADLPETRRAAVQRVISWYTHAAAAARACMQPLEPVEGLDSPPADTTVPVFAAREDAIAWFEVERTNLLAATRVAQGAGLDRAAWQLAAVLSIIYADQNAFDDWFETSRIGLAAARRLADRHAEVALLASLAMACTQSGRLDEGTEYQLQVLAIRRELGNAFGEADALNGLGLLSRRRWKLEEARLYFEQSLAGFRALGESGREARLVGNLALVYGDLDRCGEAAELAKQALNAFREQGNRYSEANTLRVLGRIQRQQGQPERALESVEAAVTIVRELNNRVPEAYWLLELGDVQRALGQPTHALVSYQRSGVIHRQIGDRGREALAWDGTGLAYRELGRFEEAAAFHRQAAAVQRALGDHWNLALALEHLATALHNADRPHDARPYWDEALTLLAPYDDPQARRTREHIQQAVQTE